MKKLLTFILGICLLIPGVFMMSACEQNPLMESWDGSVAEMPEISKGIISIKTAEELAAFAKSVNQGTSYAGITVRLENDLDMREKTWIPIGIGNRSNLEEAKPFTGTFDGNGKKIIGLSNEGYIPEASHRKLEGDFTSGNVYTYQYGLFGITKNATIKNLTVSVEFECNNAFLKGDSVGGLVGFATEGLRIQNCAVHGEVEGYDAIGGLVGRSYNSSSQKRVTITNSTNNADVEALFKGAGILGYLTSANLNATVDRCVNHGDVDVEGMDVGTIFTSRVAGILNFGWNTSSENSLVITNNINRGELSVAERLSQNLPNYHAYAYIANSVGQSFNEFKHIYSFKNNTNKGFVSYLKHVVADANVVKVLLNQTYPNYNKSLEADGVEYSHTHTYTGDNKYFISQGKAYYRSGACACGAYNNVELENYIIATPSTAQNILDSTDENLTIVLSAGTYGNLYIRKNNKSVELNNPTWAGGAAGTTFRRTMKNVTILGTEGTIVSSIVGEAADYTPNVNNNHSLASSNRYLSMYLDIENLTIRNITFNPEENTTAVRLAGSGQKISINGLTIDNCVVNGTGTITSGNMLFVSDNQIATEYTLAGETVLVGYRKNITITNNVLNSLHLGVKINFVENLTVNGNQFNEVKGRDLLIGGGSGVIGGNITISNNTSNGATERFMRLSNLNGTLNITNNVITNNMGADEDIVKITGITLSSTVNFEGNTWNGLTDTQAKDGGKITTNYVGA